MNSRNFLVLLLIWFCIFRETITVNKNTAITRGLVIYRTMSTTQQSCNCPISFSCSCCQSVIILYTKRKKDLCINFTYQRNGLNVDVTLSSDTINTRTVIDYKAFQFCVLVPGCLFSTACINIMELNRFPRSLTICPRLNIYAKKQVWQINYNCLSVSTELPMVPTNVTTRIMDSERVTINDRPAGSSTAELATAMASTQMPIMGMLQVSTAETIGMTRKAGGMTEMNSEQIIAY